MTLTDNYLNNAVIGIICKDDIAALSPSLFLNFRLGLTNYLKTKFVEAFLVAAPEYLGQLKNEVSND